MFLEFIQLKEEIIRKCENRPVLLALNGGNWGDGLIRYATVDFLNRIGVRFEVMRLTEFSHVDNTENKDIDLTKYSLVLASGGGYWRLGSKDKHLRIAALAKRVKHVIVLPCSYDMKIPDYFTPNISFYARDKFQSQDNVPQAKFCHDMAFAAHDIMAVPGVGAGLFFRKDAEKVKGSPIFENSIDISGQGTAWMDIHGFLERISEYSTILSNRTHVCIAGALMGKNVHMFSNSYFKNEAVFKSTLSIHFPKVEFHRELKVDIVDEIIQKSEDR